MKYRKKPVIIEAFEVDLLLTNIVEKVPTIPEWFLRAKETGDAIINNDSVSLKMLEGWMIAGRGNYIIQGVKGEIYSCRGDIFVQTYEPVKD